MCKDCECHDFLKQKGSGYDGDYRGRGHWCMYKITIQYPHGDKAIYVNHKPMTYKEFIKTPIWCPKNQKNYIVEGIECPIISVKTGIL